MLGEHRTEPQPWPVPASSDESSKSALIRGARPGSALRVRAHRMFVWLGALLLVIVALLPRVVDLDSFYTTDEAYFWQDRVAHFAAALSMEDWANTNQTGHPGVTTMWLGVLGRALAEGEAVPAPGPGSGAAYLAYLRLPLAIVNALAVGLGYLLLMRLLRPGTALLAGLFWATSPFLIAHSRVLHLDALLTSFVTLSLLCLLGATARDNPPVGLRRAMFVGSAIFAGLALLTKAPALLLLPTAGLLLFSAELRPCANTIDWRARLATRVAWAALAGAIWRSTLRFLLWLAIAAAVFYALWPVMWVDPVGALGAMINEVVANGGRAHSAGNYFMGQAIADPGWTFYLAVIRWRGEPFTTLGLTVLIGLGLAQLVEHRQPSAAQGHAGERRVMLVLLGFALLFIFALTEMAKKFDRYALPIWPALEILAAIGVMTLADWWRQRAQVGAALKGRVAMAVAGVGLLFSLAAPLRAYSPYYLAYYNPLLGGGTTAQEVLLAGWGEGMEQVGGWLSQRPDLDRGALLSWLPATLIPFVPAGVPVYDLDIDTIRQPANYAVVYTSVAERDTRAVAEAYALQTPPLFTLRVRGVTYATVHQLPRPYTQAVGAVFAGIQMRGFSHEVRGSTLLITPSWDIQIDQPGGVWSFVHVLDAHGRRVAQIDTAIDDGMFANWQAGQQFGTPLPIGLPTDLPPGEYKVVIGLYTPAIGTRLSLTHGPALPQSIDGPDTLILDTLSLPESCPQCR